MLIYGVNKYQLPNLQWVSLTIIDNDDFVCMYCCDITDEHNTTLFRMDLKTMFDINVKYVDF